MINAIIFPAIPSMVQFLDCTPSALNHHQYIACRSQASKNRIVTPIRNGARNVFIDAHFFFIIVEGEESYARLICIDLTSAVALNAQTLHPEGFTDDDTRTRDVLVMVVVFVPVLYALSHIYTHWLLRGCYPISVHRARDYMTEMGSLYTSLSMCGQGDDDPCI
ncbi:hypothetical protein CBL_05979 [Carabus blaptoides fortunei]